MKHGWERVSNWECLFVIREKGLFFSVYVDEIKLAGKDQHISPTWKILMKDIDLGEPTSFLDHVNLGCTQRECEVSKDVVDNYRSMFEPRISAGATEKLPTTRAMEKPMPKRYLHGPTIWKVMPRNVWNDIASWQAGRLNNSTKYLLHALMTINSKKKNLKSVGDRLVKSMLSNCSEMSVFGSFWKTQYSIVSEQICTINYKMDQSL